MLHIGYLFMTMLPSLVENCGLALFHSLFPVGFRWWMREWGYSVMVVLLIPSLGQWPMSRAAMSIRHILMMMTPTIGTSLMCPLILPSAFVQDSSSLRRISPALQFGHLRYRKMQLASSAEHCRIWVLSQGAIQWIHSTLQLWSAWTSFRRLWLHRIPVDSSAYRFDFFTTRIWRNGVLSQPRFAGVRKKLLWSSKIHFKLLDA